MQMFIEIILENSIAFNENSIAYFRTHVPKQFMFLMYSNLFN